MFNGIKFLKAEAELETGENWMKEGVAHAPLLAQPTHPKVYCVYTEHSTASGTYM
jgi:hypothetical protein